MATKRPTCNDCRFFQPDEKVDKPGSCNHEIPDVEFDGKKYVTTQRPSADPTDVACHALQWVSQ
jgi:hypothetical protein